MQRNQNGHELASVLAIRLLFTRASRRAPNWRPRPKLSAANQPTISMRALVGWPELQSDDRAHRLSGQAGRLAVRGHPARRRIPFHSSACKRQLAPTSSRAKQPAAGISGGLVHANGRHPIGEPAAGPLDQATRRQDAH